MCNPGKLITLTVTLLTVVLAACDSRAPADRESVSAGRFAQGAQMAAAPSPAELVLKNGYIYTVDARRSIHQAIAIRAGRIVFVGTSAGADAFIGPATRVEDLQGKLVLPGFVDALARIGNQGRRLHLYGGQQVGDYQAAVADFIDANPGLQLVVGQGWRPAAFGDGAPHKAQLDQVNDLIPIVLYSEDRQSIWTNSEALAAAGITMETVAPDGGTIGRDANGLAIGVFRGAPAMALVERIIPPAGAGEHRAEIVAAQQQRNRWGITSMHATDIHPGDTTMLAALREMATKGELTLRLRGSLAATADMTGEQLAALKQRAETLQRGELRIHSVSLSVTNPLDQIQAGTVARQKQINQFVTDANRQGLQVQLHAEDDLATRMALQAFAHASGTRSAEAPRNSLAPWQLAQGRDFRLLQRTKTIALLEPPRLASTRKSETGRYPATELLRRDIAVASGSGSPVSQSVNPFAAIQLGVVHRGQNQFRGLVSISGDVTALEQMVAVFTINGAFANRIEGETGSLEIGKWADFILLDQNLFQIPPEQIHRTRVLRTYFKGRPVYRAGAALRQ
ncbi:amidohydrolase [Microbulbifer sp. TYP-18]|uniref:amidohydrolase n=1 Tax=Microbulbifer sp. TYP-18 TaxID=3230024 RepID=UPI0034C6604C